MESTKEAFNSVGHTHISGPLAPVHDGERNQELIHDLQVENEFLKDWIVHLSGDAKPYVPSLLVLIELRRDLHGRFPRDEHGPIHAPCVRSDNSFS